MFKFIQKLFSPKKGKRTVVIFNDDGTEESTSHKFKPRNLWLFAATILGSTVVLVVFLMIFTPLGGFVYNQQKLRKSVIVMQQQVAALQDSMNARNMQLQNLRKALFSGKDSVFTAIQPVTEQSGSDLPQNSYQLASLNEFQLPRNDTFVSSLLRIPVQFPAPWPVDGTLTRTYNNESGHYGIDIAADKGAYFHAIAGGVVVGVNRSLNYGNVLYIQHGNGIITVYKHASEIAPEIGDIISRGDVLGRVGNTGILSSGPHLHMEIWANGIAQNPLHYLINHKS